MGSENKYFKGKKDTDSKPFSCTEIEAAEKSCCFECDPRKVPRCAVSRGVYSKQSLVLMVLMVLMVTLHWSRRLPEQGLKAMGCVSILVAAIK